MKKFIAIALVLTMVLSLFAGCGAKTPATETQAPNAPVASVEGTMEELLNKIVEKQPVEFMGGTMPVDLTDTSEDGLWAIKYYTGLENADSITEAAFFEPMMGSIAFSMVAVRVAEGADVKAVAESMKAGIDTRKWICVEADDLMVAGYGDVVMLIMVASDSGLTAQSYVDAFGQVVGGEVTVF
jgi:predicted small lipoprotein YifL